MKTPSEFTSDAERFAWIREHLYVPAICDVLDALGCRDRAMHQRLRPLDPANCVIVGRARTFRWMDTDYVQEEDPYGLEIAAMDSLGPGDVAVHSTDAAGTNAPWGELMSTVAKRNGAVRLHLRQQHSRLRADHRHGVPGVLCRHSPARQHGTRESDGLRRTGALRRRPRAAGRARLRRFRRHRRRAARSRPRRSSRAFEKAAKENVSRRDLLKGDSLRTVFDRYGVL